MSARLFGSARNDINLEIELNKHFTHQSHSNFSSLPNKDLLQTNFVFAK